LLLNLYDVLSLWILGKKKEFFVKKMVGASVWQILWRAFANYWILIVLSFGLGLWCSVLIATISKSFSVQINTALLSLVIGGLISLISGWLMLGRRLQIIQKGKRQ